MPFWRVPEDIIPEPSFYYLVKPCCTKVFIRHTFFTKITKAENLWKISGTLNFYDFLALLCFKSKKVGFRGSPGTPKMAFLGSGDPKIQILGFWDPPKSDLGPRGPPKMAKNVQKWGHLCGSFLRVCEGPTQDPPEHSFYYLVKPITKQETARRGLETLKIGSKGPKNPRFWGFWGQKWPKNRPSLWTLFLEFRRP